MQGTRDENFNRFQILAAGVLNFSIKFQTKGWSLMSRETLF